MVTVVNPLSLGYAVSIRLLPPTAHARLRQEGQRQAQAFVGSYFCKMQHGGVPYSTETDCLSSFVGLCRVQREREREKERERERQRESVLIILDGGLAEDKLVPWPLDSAAETSPDSGTFPSKSRLKKWPDGTCELC